MDEDILAAMNAILAIATRSPASGKPDLRPSIVAVTALPTTIETTSAIAHSLWFGEPDDPSYRRIARIQAFFAFLEHSGDTVGLAFGDAGGGVGPIARYWVERVGGCLQLTPLANESLGPVAREEGAS